MRKKFVAVIGYGKSGKSTIIQSLTGCGNRGFTGIVEDLSENRSIYVHAASPQEQPRTDEPAFRRILQKVLRSATIQGIVIAIQPTEPNQRLSMDTVIGLAGQSSFESFAFVLDPPYNNATINFGFVRDRVLASDPNASVFRLDGRRFAILNSEAIRALARFPY